MVIKLIFELLFGFMVGVAIGYVVWEMVIERNNVVTKVIGWIKKNSRSSPSFVYNIILSEHVHNTPKEQIIRKLMNRYKLKEQKARTLYEIALIGDEEWFKEEYNK